MRRLVLVVGLLATTQPLLADSRSVELECTRVVASDARASELRVVGTVVQDTERKLVLLDAQQRRHVVVVGECAGRERIPYSDWLRKTFAR